MRQFTKAGSLILSVVETFLNGIEKQELAKQDPSNKLDQDCKWISISGILIWGILNCEGTNRENSEVFQRVVQPEMQPHVFASDKELRQSIFLIINMATILNWMKTDMHKRAQLRTKATEEFEYHKYTQKMTDYALVFDKIVKSIINEVFGKFSNSISQEEFLENMAFNGWKYYERQNVNQIFHIRYQKMVDKGQIEDIAAIDESCPEEFFNIEKLVIF